MADLKLDLNWDIEDGQIVFYVSAGETELAQLTLDPETIMDSLQADLEDHVSLEDWAELSTRLGEISEAIFTKLLNRGFYAG